LESIESSRIQHDCAAAPSIAALTVQQVASRSEWKIAYGTTVQYDLATVANGDGDRSFSLCVTIPFENFAEAMRRLNINSQRIWSGVACPEQVVFWMLVAALVDPCGHCSFLAVPRDGWP
jgi:hypothetical protein